LLVDFPDNIGQENKGLYEALLFSSGTYPTGSMRDYFAEVSYGQFEVVGDVNGTDTPPNWYVMPETYAYYVNGQYGFGYYPRNAQKLAEAAVIAADPYVDYTRYDNDQDGVVDSLFIIHAGPGAEASGSTSDIWSHRWVMRTPPVLDGMYFSGYSMEP
jgi:immune inhibitor A